MIRLVAPGAGGGAADARLAGGPRVTLGGEDGVFLMPYEDVADVVIVYRVVERQGNAAGIAEENIDPFAGKAFEQHGRAVHQATGFGTVCFVHNVLLKLQRSSLANS